MKVYRIGSGRWRSAGEANASFCLLAVLILLMATYSLALSGPGGPWARPAGGGPSLVEAEAELREVLTDALDRAVGRALRGAPTAEGVPLGDVLDACLVSGLSAGLPATAGGWGVDLVEAWGGLEQLPSDPAEPGSPRGARVPAAGMVVRLVPTSGGRGEEITMAVRARSGSGGLPEVASRVASLSSGLRDPSGPVALGAAGALWPVAQGRCIAGRRDPGGLVTEAEVLDALLSTVRSLASGGGVPAPAAPRVDLASLVRQSVRGAVERDLGWMDGYLGLDGLPGGLGDAEMMLREAALDAVVEVEMGLLEGLLSDSGVVISGEDLAAVVDDGLEVLGRLERELLEREWSVDAACCVLEGILPGVVPGVVSNLVTWLSTSLRAIALVGLESARWALLGIGLSGRQVAGEVPGAVEVLGGMSVGLVDVEVSTSWSGVRACGPPGLVRRVADALLDGGNVVGEEPGGTLPYTSVGRTLVRGWALVRAEVPGSASGATEASWCLPIDLQWDLELASGWPLEGVAYAPSATLGGDLAGVVHAIYDGACASVGWLTARFRDAAERLGSWAGDLYGEMVDSVMTASAYTVSQALWSIGESLVSRKVNAAINGTWDLLMDLFGDDLREALTWRWEVLGCAFAVSFDVARGQLDLTVERGRVFMNVSVRRLCDPHPPFRARPVEGYYWGVFGEARLDLGERGAVLYLDPLTLEHASVLSMVLAWGDDEGGGELAMEAMEAKELPGSWSVSLSKLAGVGMLSAAAGGIVDAGLVVRGDFAKEGALGKALHRAMKSAWLASVRGWRVGDLVGQTGKGPDSASFLSTLMRELQGALEEQGARLVPELELYLEARFPSPGWPTVRLSLVLSRPLDSLLPLAAWARRSVGPLLGAAPSGAVEGAGEAMATWLAEQVELRFELAWAMEPPGWLASRAGSSVPDRLGLVVRFQVNAAALGALAGRGRGRWEARAEVLLRGVPGALLALVPGMGSPEWEWAEVTLLRVVLREVEHPVVLVSQVLYDALGRDADLEFVELLNAGRGMLDLDGFRLSDEDGSFLLRGHLPLLPGDHMLVARNATAVREEWGALPDVGRMGLMLANDGDSLMVQDPDGYVMDLVSWEAPEGEWASLATGEGMALVRLEGDLRPMEPSAWCVAPPRPRAAGW